MFWQVAQGRSINTINRNTGKSIAKQLAESTEPPPEVAVVDPDATLSRKTSSRHSSEGRKSRRTGRK